MSILSTLNKLTGKQDKNVLAALNSLTGKTADDIEEAVGNLSAGDAAGPEYTNPKRLSFTVSFNGQPTPADFEMNNYRIRTPQAQNSGLEIPFSPIFARKNDPTYLTITVDVAEEDIPNGVNLEGTQPSVSWRNTVTGQNQQPYNDFPAPRVDTWVSLDNGCYSCDVSFPSVDFAKITTDHSTLRIDTTVS